MQTLGLSDTTPRIENRLKSLFWPSIKTGSDVDYMGAQGYWLCTAIGVGSFAAAAASGHAFLGLLILMLFYLGGMGVRERDRYAAAVVFLMYVAGSVPSLQLLLGLAARVLFAALLLSNLRATWIASRWTSDSDDAVLPPRLHDTWMDKFVDQWPRWLWPRIRTAYYVFAAVLLLATGFVLWILLHGATRADAVAS